MKQDFHIPGRPTTPEPKKLVRLAASVSHPDVVNSGITTTTKGDWALLLTVRKNAAIPIKMLEKKASGFPVVYQEDSGRMLVARPAYPGLGE